MNEDYLDDLYKSFDSIDPTFKNDVSIEQFKQKMQDINYAKQIYNTLSSVDETYSSDVPFDSFIEQTRITPKKKEESMVSESETSSSVLPSGDGGITGRFKKGFEEATKFPQKVQQDVSKLKKFDTTQQYDKFGVPITQFPAPAREEYLAKPVQQIETKVKFEEKKEELEKKVPEFLKPSVETIDKDFLSRTVDPVISDLNRQYKGTGFEFYVDPRDKEGIIAKAPNGKTINVSLGYTNVEWFTSRKDEAERLKFFIKENSPSIGSENIVKLQKEYEQGKQNFLTEKQIEEQNKAFNEYAESLNKEIQSFLPETDMMQKMLKQIESYPEEQRNTPEYKSLVDDYNIKLEGYNKKASELDTKIKGIKEKENNLTIAAGEYTKYKAQQGAFSGYLWRQTTDAIGNIAAGWTEFMADRYWNNVSLPLVLGREYYGSIFNMKAEEMYGKKKFMTNEERENVNNSIRDDFKKLQKTGKIEKIGLDLSKERVTSDDIREFFTKTFGTFSTTKEFQERINKEGNIIQRGLGGLAGSLPAMIGNKYIRIANMYMLTTDAVAKQMQDDPDFKDISENEKEIVKIPIGIVGAALEEFGFRNAIKGKSVISEITKRVLGKIPTNATASQIRKTALSEIKEISLRGGLALLGSALAEAETGALQQVNEFLVKDIYNAAKGKRMFDTPETVGEYLYKVGDAAATESVGVFVIGVPNAISTAFSKDGFQGLDDDTFRLFEELSKATDSKNFFVIDLKNKINEGKITNADASKMLENYDKSVGLVQQIPDEITDVNDRKVAMDLLVERKRLKDKVQNKDPALAKPIQNKIDQINEQLTKLTEDAIQKQTAGEVPVQPETGVGEEVVQGEPEPELEVTPEQIVTEEKPKEEVVAPEGVVEKKDIQVYRGTSTGNKSDKDGVSYHTTDRGYAAFYETGKEKPENKVLEELESLKPPTPPSKIELSTNEEIDAYVDDYISMAEDAKKFKPETKIPSREEAISELKKQNQIFTTQEEVDNANNKQDEKYNSDLEKYNQKKSELENEAKNYLSPKKLSGNFFSLGIDFSKMNPQQIFEKLKSLGISSVFKGGNFLDNYHSDLVEFARKNNIDFYDGITGGIQGSMNTAPQEIIEISKLEQAPVEVKTPEQEADLLEELITGKKKEPVMTPKEETMTPKEEIMTPKEEEVIPEGKPEIPKIEEIEETDIEIKDTQTTPEETQKQIEEFDETKIPEQEKPKPGMVAELDINEINADPQRFQYKEVTDKETGVNEQFKDPKAPFTKELANVISVWIDPNDGKTYVINGHHRLDYAKRSGEKTMNVIYIDAKDASEARLKGAMQNIAEGQGTDMDAAKVFRETGMTVEQLQSRGINVKGAKAMNGLSLASLADSIFNLVVQGKLSQSIGIIIGSTIQDKNVQEQFYNVIKGKNLNNGTIKVMAEDIQAAKKEKVEDRQLSMFGGVDEQAAYQQRATFIASVRLLVAKAKNILGRVARSDDFLREYGNEIDRNASETGSRESAMALAVFDKLRNTSPEIRQMIDEGVERISKGENKNKVINETAKRIIEATPGILEGVTGQPVAGRGEVKEPSAKGKQGATTKEEGVITEKPKEEAVEETKNLLDVPVKPFKKAVDLLGDPRQDWMYEATERELEQSKKKDTMRGSQYYPKKITAIENAVKKGKFEKAVQEGRMSAQDAKQIIESAGLKVPKTIEDLLSKPEKKKEKKPSDALKNIAVGETTMTKAEAKAELDALTQKEQAVTKEVTKELVPKEEYTSKNLPTPIGDFEVVEVIPYTDVEKNKFTPNQQLKFNQGNKYKPVRIVGDPELIELIQIGSIVRNNLTSSTKKPINKTRQKQLEEKFGITAIDANEKAKELAKQNRDNIENIIIIGKKEIGKKGKQGAKGKGKKLSDAVKSLKIKGPGGLQSNLFGVPIAIWNAAMDTVAAAIDAGVAISEAIQRGADYISENYKKRWQKAQYENRVLDAIYTNAINLARENGISDDGIKRYLERKGLTTEQIDKLIKKRVPKEKKPPTAEEIVGKPKPKKVTVNEMAALKDQIELEVKAAREGAKSVSDAIKAITKYFNSVKDKGNLTRKDIAKILNLISSVDSQEKLDKVANQIDVIVRKAKSDIIEVSEAKALKDQIRLEARAAREAKGDLNTKRKMLAEAINKLVAKGTLTVRQANAIIKRVNFVNLDNPVMVERLINYAGNIFNDADYDTRMQEIRGLQSQVKKKNHTSMEGTVKDFISINPELIPDNRILEYIQALDDMNTRTPSYVKMNDMFDEVMSYKTEPEGFNAIKTFQQLMDKLESIALNEVKSVEDYINLIRDINAFKRKASQLLSNGDITQAQYDQAIENVGKDQKAVEKKYEKELTALKQGLINEIEKLRPKTNPNFTPEENALIEKYLEIGKDNLMKLAPEELYILNDLLQNIEDGQMDYYRFSDIVSKAYSKDAIDKTTEQLDKTKFDMALDKGKQLLSEFESSFWEGLLGMGRVTSGALQKFIVSPMMRAISSYEKFLQDSYNTFSKIKNKYGMNQNNMNKLGMLTTYLQEYMAQFDPSYKGTKDIGKRDWFKEILNDKDMKKQYPSEKLTMRRLFGKVVGRGKTQLESMKEIWNSLPKDKDGNVDPKAVYDSYMANDGKYFSKKEKAFFDEIMDWKQKNTTTKQKAANELKGNPFKEIPFHLLRSRYGEGAKQIAPKASGANGMVRIEAGTGKERKDQKLGPININFEQLFINGVEQTARDYYLSTAIQDVNNVMSGVASNLGKGKKTLVETITGTLSEALNYEFDKTESFAIFKRLLAARASMVLFDPERTARELIAGLLSYPIRAKTLSGYKDLFRGVKRMKELLDFTESPIRLRENISSALDISDGQIKKMNPLQKATLYLAGFPERTMMVTSWMPNFRSEFKNLTGNDFDMEAFRTDKTYKQEYGKAIREAAAVADAQTEKIIGTTTKAGQRREIRIAPEFLANLVGKRGTVSKNTVFGQVFGFFTNYPYREVTEFFNGFKEAAEVIRNNGISSTPQAAAQLSKPLGIAFNVALYGYLASVSYAYWLMLLGDDDDEERGKQQLEELSTTKGIVEDFQGNAISLLASRYGVGSKALFQVGGTIAYGMSEDEERKKWIKKFMKGSMYIDPLPVEKATEYKGKEAVLASISSYVPQLVVAADRYIDIIEGAGDVNKLYEKINEKGIDALTEDEKGQVLAISALFKTSQLALNATGNSLPMYNKMKIYMKKLRTESGVTEKTASSEKREAYGGFKTIEELEIADPKKYKELSKKGGALYEFRQKEKAQRKVSEEKKAKEYEEKYGVKPKSKSKKSTTEGEGRGGETRGGGREESTRGGGR